MARLDRILQITYFSGVDTFQAVEPFSYEIS